jgi:aldehyde dehydrogenase (NAD+)
VPEGRPAGSPTAVASAARAAFESGLTVPVRWRREQLRALDLLLTENADEIQAALRADLGRHPMESYLAEIGTVRADITETLRKLRRWTRSRTVAVPATLMPAVGRIVRQPLGVVLIIAPWNYPVNLLLTPLVGAIAAGNAVVLKPSELAPMTSAVLARLITAYLDRRAVHVVEGGVDETTELLESRWDHIFYTGNGAVGRIIMAAAARNLTPVTLELGGKSPVWVDESVDEAMVARWLVWGKFLNAGQTCVAPDYVLTTAGVAPRLIAALRSQITASYGDDPRSSGDYARIVNSRHLDRLVALLGSGSIAVGGEVDRADRYLAPTVLQDVRLGDPVMNEEIFGPILPIVTVGGFDEAIEIITARDKPLALYVFTHRREVRDAFHARTSSGSMGINAPLLQLGVPALPFGGVGPSGMGAYHGEHSIRTFSHERAVLRRLRGPHLSTLVHPPFSARKQRVILGWRATGGRSSHRSRFDLATLSSTMLTPLAGAEREQIDGDHGQGIRRHRRRQRNRA